MKIATEAGCAAPIIYFSYLSLLLKYHFEYERDGRRAKKKEKRRKWYIHICVLIRRERMNIMFPSCVALFSSTVSSILIPHPVSLDIQLSLYYLYSQSYKYVQIGLGPITLFSVIWRNWLQSFAYCINYLINLGKVQIREISFIN